MNILFFEQNAGVAGGEIWMIDAMQKLRARGHNTFFLCPSDAWGARHAEANGLAYNDYFFENEEHVHWRLLECLQNEEIDLVFSGLIGQPSRLRLLDTAIREAGKGGLILRIGISWTPFTRPFSLKSFGLPTIQGIIAVSKHIQNLLLCDLPDFPPERIHVLYNGVDLQRFNPKNYSSADRQTIRKIYGIPEHHLVIGALGRIDKSKGLSLLIRASKEVLSKFPNTSFLIMGQGDYKRVLVGIARQIGVLNHVHFTGFVEDVPRLLAGIDILAHPSQHCEGVPNAIMEAMAMAKPVVATPVGGVTELLEDGRIRSAGKV